MAFCLVVKKAITETDVFNELRSCLNQTQLEILQLVAPGGQAPLSLTYNPKGAKRPKTVYPDLIAYHNHSIYIGELKPRFSKADAEKLISIRESEDAAETICKIVQRRGKNPLAKNPAVIFLMVHTQEDAPRVDGIIQVVFLAKGGVVLCGDIKVVFHNALRSLENVISSFS